MASDSGLERAAPVRTLVQKLRAGEQFLARGRVHRRKTHPVKDVGFLLFCFARKNYLKIVGRICIIIVTFLRLPNLISERW